MQVDIVTPTRKLAEGMKADAVRLPSVLGELQILPGHTELLTLLATGVMAVQTGGVEKKYAISYGFAEIRDDRIIVMAETAEEGSEIDKARAQRAQKKAEDTLNGSVLTEDTFKKHQLKLQRAMARQTAAV